ncbi:2,3-dihydroxy-2,3-dihydro-p-cumate dehydrogenase [Prauserella marina]|uniref:2,3-dihydroxy-2,3-dihydro-p-cumate dehydrogenase n=1 Tax=Prauserella marina TaxID=530584 RepID=A0A1G6JE94_9PSEU|nr:SDR family oxidoreductase [Prauserella marina]PWV84647.1 2,3-dihydroxy-2,3-dihydro-p-cumate dehydrogenase [Prauserella marina]SDC16745.1 2,3-dihydroxy-2,3-dihydro-p-cumate dehydrogenase [Prauserella marina]
MSETFISAGRFRGRVVVVTGAAGGIGGAIVARAAGEEATLVASDRKPDGENVVAAVLGNRNPQWSYVDADLGDEDGSARLVEHALDRFGRIDVLINNAGGGIIRDFLEHTGESRKETVDRNLWTVVNCCTAALPSMRESGYGRIVNVGADSVRNGLFQHAMYNAAKGGVHALTTGLAREFARDGITVNTVAPTGTTTPYVLSRPPDAVERFAKNEALIPMGRFASTAEVASAVLYLASEEASFITGQVVSVNGGSTML